MRRPHDEGGLPGGLIAQGAHEVALWEKRIDAVTILLIGKGVFTADESRYAIELLGSDVYERLSYYERWTHSTAHNLIQRGVITVDELGRRMAEIEKAGRR
jgi:hypothetical protein